MKEGLILFVWDLFFYINASFVFSLALTVK